MTHELATKRLIDSVWTCVFERVEGGVKILAYDRTIGEGYERERELPRCSLVETKDNKRTVLAIELAPYGDFEYWPTAETVTETLPVVNPQNVFSYGSDY